MDDTICQKAETTMNSVQPPPAKLGKFTIPPSSLSDIEYSSNTEEDKEEMDALASTLNSSDDNLEKAENDAGDGILNIDDQGTPLASTDKEDMVNLSESNQDAKTLSISDVMDAAYGKFKILSVENEMQKHQMVEAIDSFVTMATRTQALLRKKLKRLADIEQGHVVKQKEVQTEIKEQRQLTQDWMSDISDKLDGWEMRVKERCDAMKLTMDTNLAFMERRLTEKYRGLEDNAGATCEKLALYIDVNAKQMTDVCKKLEDLRNDVTNLYQTQQRNQHITSAATNGCAQHQFIPYKKCQNYHQLTKPIQNLKPLHRKPEKKNDIPEKRIIWTNNAVNALSAIKTQQRKQKTNKMLKKIDSQKVTTKYLVTDLPNMTIANKSLGQFQDGQFQVSCTTVQYLKSETDRIRIVDGVKKMLKWYLAVKIENVQNANVKIIPKFNTKIWIALKFISHPQQGRHKAYVIVPQFSPPKNPSMPSKHVHYRAFESDYQQYKTLSRQPGWRASLGVFCLEGSQVLEISIDGSKIRLP